MISPSLTILIPCLNEALGIAAVVHEYAAAFPGADILVVDNNSQDATAEIARGAGASVIRERRQGKATAVSTAIRSAQQATEVFRPMHQWGMSVFAAVLRSVFRFQPLDLFSGLRLFSRRFYKHVPVLSRG